MKTIGIISTAALTLVLGIAAPVYAQQDEHQQQEQKDKPAQQEPKGAPQEEKKGQPSERQPQQEQPRAQQEKAQQSKPAQQEEQQRKDAKPAQQNEHSGQQQDKQVQQEKEQPSNKPAQHNEQRAQQQRPAAQPQRTQEQQRVEQTAWQQHSSQRWDSDHRTWQQRGGYRGYRIPDDRFRGYFGESHGFRIYGLPFLVVSGYPRFQYDGYWFSLVDPWPGSWANNWYDTDDVYVTYVNNGYYLFNQRYPNVAIAVSISL